MQSTVFETFTNQIFPFDDAIVLPSDDFLEMNGNSERDLTVLSRVVFSRKDNTPPSCCIFDCLGSRNTSKLTFHRFLKAEYRHQTQVVGIVR